MDVMTQNPQSPTVLVTGATGGVGRHVVDGLIDRGVSVRALVRDVATASLPAGVDLVAGDLADPASLDGALEGTDAVFLLWPFFSAEGVAPVVDAIISRPRRVVYLSAQAAADDAESFWALVERALDDSGVPSTFLRPTGFAKNTLGWADQVRSGVVTAPFGDAARSLIDERDIAAVAVLALTEDGHAGQTHVLSGPATVTQREQVDSIGTAIGRPVRWVEQDPKEARPGMLEFFGDEAFVDNAMRTWSEFVTRPELVTSTVEDLTGAPARSYQQWADDHADAFR